jgi:serpin B
MRKDHSLVAGMAAGAGALLLCAALAPRAAAADGDVPEEAVQLAERMNRLGSETLARLAGKGDSNVVVSPYGLGSALHLLLLGAKGSGDRSLRQKLLPTGMVKQDDALKALNERVLRAGAETLKLTSWNAVFVPPAAQPTDKFRKRTRDILDAWIETVDIKGKGAVGRINAWAKEATSGLVPRVIDDLDPEARFVLTNAVYFNGAWETAFDPRRTARAPFTCADGSQRDVDMMDALLTADLAEIGDLQAVWLPYAGRDVAMLVIAPAAGAGPTAVAEALQAKSLDRLMAAAQASLRRASVQVRLPRFRAESGLDITEVLASEIGPALAAGSNYEAINKARSGPLLVIHRAVVEVGEAGTRAAAATAITSDRSLTVTPVLSADRPFVFAVVHRPTRVVLFAGYVADPGGGAGPAAEPRNVR